MTSSSQTTGTRPRRRSPPNPGPTLSDGCCSTTVNGVFGYCAAGEWANAADVVGKIAVVDRGVCGFSRQGEERRAAGRDRRDRGQPLDRRQRDHHDGPDGRHADQHLLFVRRLRYGQYAEGPASRARRERDAALERPRPRRLLPLARVARTRRAFGGAHPRHVVAHLPGLARQGHGHGVLLRDRRRRRRAHQLRRAEPRVRAAGGRRDVQRPDHRPDRPDQGRAHLLPRHGRLPGPGQRLRGPRGLARGVVRRPDRRRPARSRHRRAVGAGRSRAVDCAQVAKAALAVELRTPPTQCNFQPMLAKNPPDRCEAGRRRPNVYATDFETDPIGSWTVSHTGVFARLHAARLGVDERAARPSRLRPVRGEHRVRQPAAIPSGDESGVLHADSPVDQRCRRAPPTRA